MKRYIFLSLAFVITIAMSSCTKNSDAPIDENNPSGDYEYTSNSRYYTDGNEDPLEYSSDGLMYVSWYLESTSINITVNPFIGYSYELKGTNLDCHGDTTTFRLSYQIVYISDQEYKIIGKKDVDVPNIGTYDGYYIQDKKIVYSFKSTNTESYETTETRTEGRKY